MKFTKQLEFYKIPEWSEYYFSYSYIKKILKRMTKPKKKNTKEEIFFIKHRILRTIPNQTEYNELEDQSNQSFNTIPNEEIALVEQGPKALNNEDQIPSCEFFKDFSDNEKVDYFINEYKKKLLIIQNFFFNKIEECRKSLENLQEKIKVKKKSLPKIKIPRNTSISPSQAFKERDELGYAVSYKRAMSFIYNQTSWLHSFYSTNSLAIQKIHKKAKKLMHNANIFTIDDALTQADKDFPFFNSLGELVQLRREIKKIYCELFTQNNMAKAKEELNIRLKGIGKIKHTKVIFFSAGIIVACILFFIFLEFIKPPECKLAPFFPAFNFTLVFIEVLLGIGVNILILRRYRINYIYILEIDPENRLGFSEMFQNGTVLLSIWMIMLLCAKMTLYFDLFWDQTALFALIVNLSLLIFLFFPFHCSYYQFRKGIIETLMTNLFPIGKQSVRFKDFLLGDVLTSLNKPFASLMLSFCLLSCKQCRDNNTRIHCNRDTYPCLIVLLAPFFIRLFQCINRLYYTREAWPHLGNSIKYIGGILNTFFGWYYSYAKKTHTALILHLVFGGVPQMYMLFWDIYMDWNLGRIKTKNFFLRDKIVYPKAMYYCAIVINAFLRFCWLFNFVDTSSWVDDEWKNLFFAVLEVYRRIQWCVFRIENENTNNPEKYRAILAIPDLPLD